MAVNLDLLKKLIEGDEVDTGQKGVLSGKYTCEKPRTQTGGSYLEWLEIAKISYPWYEIEGEYGYGNLSTKVVQPIIKLEKGNILYNPSIIQDYIEKTA